MGNCAKRLGILSAVVLFCIFLQLIINDSDLGFAIVILSARDNFQRRDAIRKTWLNKTVKGIDAWFLVGSQPCMIPLSCRRKKYSCELWDANFSGVAEAFTSSSDYRESKNFGAYYKGYLFQVNHPVILTQLGVYEKSLRPGKSVNISLLDLQTKKSIVSATLGKENFDYLSDGYIYKNVEMFVLPRYFMGLLLAEGSFQKVEAYSHTNVHWNNNSGVLTFEKVYLSSDDVESVPFDDSLNPIPSMNLNVSDLEDLMSVSTYCASSFSTYRDELKAIDKKLNEEQQEWDDIIFVDVVETYRNLSKKLLLFYHWLINNHNGFRYVLKTDDDTVIDIDRVMEKLKLIERESTPSKLWIWSMFRSHWPVNYVGKWADNEYKSPVYPYFPCGAGYVVSHDLVYWLRNNINYLHHYQGEDVSMGIWLSAINPAYIADEDWECDGHCTNTSYNRAELTLQEIFESWKYKLDCGNLCHCE